ncbi:MAG: queuosine precursor transporter [Bacillota bacterium]|nr:queuosine precursor transporter [Bacillota bacterium]MDD3298526.1 queuosine precursor transporter [Bacillota bacterium]MDD3850989.1 queuosine precursor transporter [Bacillota bacterium]MDD4708122.1 queuosine precursor transporter [Bacillota bacterium]
MQDSGKLILLNGIFIVGIVIANIASTKVMAFGAWVMDAGTLVFPITFLMTDVIGEVWGKRTAYHVVWTGFACAVLATVILTLARLAPPAPFWQGQEAFDQIIGAVPRLVIASLITYAVSQSHDVWAFHFWRGKTKGRHLWLRNNASTIVSQAIDTVLFSILAFAGTMTGNELLQLMTSVYGFKVLFALLDTPLCYLLVRWCKAADAADSPPEK